jgi:hypothetical protein
MLGSESVRRFGVRSDILRTINWPTHELMRKLEMAPKSPDEVRKRGSTLPVTDDSACLDTANLEGLGASRSLAFRLG